MEIRDQTLDQPIYKHKYYLLNKSNGSFRRINSYTDDITGHVEEERGAESAYREPYTIRMEPLNLPRVLPGGIVYVVYQPIDLIGKDLAGNSDSDLPPDLFTALKEIQQNLDEMDNPVLLVGSAKKNI